MFMWHISYYLYYDYVVSLTRLSVQLRIRVYATYNTLYDKMRSSKH